MSAHAQLVIDLPSWIDEVAVPGRQYPTDDERIALVIELSRQNVLRDNAGPFGAAVFDEDGVLVAAAVNRVEPLNNCALHAEIMALMFAQQRLGCHTLHSDGTQSFVLASSCDPCAMCLGAVLWSGVRRVICGATREDALRVGFDEGPVFPESLHYLASRGVSFTHGLRRTEAAQVLEQYVARGGTLYNGAPQ